jgi:DNA primase
MSSIEEVKERINIVDIVEETVQLKRSGSSLSGFCPFHSNTKTPSFVVWPETGTWRCFGQCGEGGDVFKFVMKRDGLDFAESLKALADKAGIQLRVPTPQETKQKEENDHLRDLLENAVKFFQQHLWENPAGKPALGYLRNRGLSDETIKTFELGYAPNGWTMLLDHFTNQDSSHLELEQVGLISIKDGGKKYDRFRNRVIFPIRDSYGKMAGFGARALSAEDEPKYLNSPQTVLFDKSKILYGLDKARKPIRMKDQAVIVEGYLDVIAPHQAGFDNIVATMGTALTSQHIGLLKRITRKLVLALDPDAAGVKATMRGLEVARTTLDREEELYFDARGLLRNEGRLSADIRVSTLPEGMDPDNVVQDNPDNWKALIESAKPVVIHVMETLIADQDINDSKVKQKIATQVMPLIQDLDSAIERDTFTQQLARLLKVEVKSLISDVQTSKRKTHKTSSYSTRQKIQPIKSTPSEKNLRPNGNIQQMLESYILALLIRKPELLNKLNKSLVENRLDRISENDFQLTKHQELFTISNQSIDQDFIEPLNYAIENLPFPLIDQTDEILLQSKDVGTNDEKILNDLLRTVLRLREVNIKQNNLHLKFLLEDVNTESNQITDYKNIIQTNSFALFNIQKAKMSASLH